MSISSDKWLLLSPYLDQALDLSDEELAPWLSSLRSGAPEVAELLEPLLREHRKLSDDGFLQTLPAELSGQPGLAGQVIGAYKLLSPIGAGGMGSVWLAERADGRFERRVAVKLLNIALMGKAGEERFKREGSFLGRLLHSHIAELIDAGLSPIGQPYLILEYVEGYHIDRYCDQHKLDVKARLRLFLDVLSAVIKAHANLIVHRDLKPSNILVRTDGQTKLLDFGIAKLLEDESQPDARIVTVEGAAMTLEYASPEQLRHEPITTATDVYALGVLLFVLLTGQHPAGPGPHAPADMVKAIVEQEPPRMSQVVSGGGAELAALNGAHRGTSVEKLRRLLRGDLDTIVAKALKKDPGERYTSVAALAEDIRRYLTDQPISVRPDSFSYRAVKFVRRNRKATALATLAISAVLAGVAGTLVQARNVRLQRDFALRQLSRALNTIEFNEFLLSDAAPAGQQFTVNELLKRAENTLARQSGGDQIARVELLAAIGDQYSTQDEAASARRVLEQAHTLSRQVQDSSARAEASCSLAGALAQDGELARAETLIQEGLRELPPGAQYDFDRIFCLRRGSEVAQERGDAQQGIARMQTVWELVKRSPFDSDALEYQPLMELGEAYRVAGQNQLADSTFKRAYELMSALGRDNTQGAVALFNDWALVLDRLGRPLQAAALYRRAIDISRVGPTEDAVSPLLLNNYAAILRELDRLDEAADYSQRAYDKGLKTGDQDAIYHALNTRALVYIDQHDFARAASALAELQPIAMRTFPPDHYWMGSLASVQALVASGSGDYNTARDLADRSVHIVEAASNAGRAGRDFLPIAYLRRATVELASGKPEQASEDAERALSLLQSATPSGESSYFIATAYLTLGRARQAQGMYSEARSAFRSAANHFQNTLGADHVETRTALRLARVEAP
ncbi:serine/threonine-protein kinase [Occallatibacter riparius]|uniref:Serine/threonine-protein kinase n=1 Tax=Occallatibacter riparius TaxID=1002689 RepID=A0A9J7BNX5_9BACT|nr:serine/threonine-protein kinase [Occallatibacter riparius]UWZ84435.1 serine/threonine-protein kinase [Occallatibacter riparius]